MKRSRAGFTLVEMLVVLAVLLLLAAILLPGGVSRTEARETTCLSNLKQVGEGLGMYTQDYDGALPWNPAPGGLPAASWAPRFRPGDCAPQPTTSFVALLAPYLRNVEDFRCPEYRGHDVSRHLAYAKSLDPAIRSQIGYGFNELVIGSPCRPRTLASLGCDLKEIALFADAEQPWASSTDHWRKVNGERAPYWAWDPAKPPRHHGGSFGRAGQNFLFADGHVRFLQPVRLGPRGANDAGDGYYPDARLE